jgi:hypothetical protein
MSDPLTEWLVSWLLPQWIVLDSSCERLLLDLLEPRANCASLAPGQLEPRIDKPPSSCNGVDFECLGRPRRYVGSFEFIALSDERNCFDADHQTTNSDTWLGRENLPRNDEVLFLIDGNRWILVYAPGPGHPNESRNDPNRELSPAAAARWLIKNEYELPPSLLPPGMRLDQLNLGTPGQDGPDRLDRNWRPPAPPAVTTPDAADPMARDSAPPSAATGGATGGEQGPEANMPKTSGTKPKPMKEPTPEESLDDRQPKAPSRKTRGAKRDHGKDDKCVGIYLKYLERNETPPGPTEIARRVGCHPSTACRVIKKWEDKRREMAKEDARKRYPLHNDEENRSL